MEDDPKFSEFTQLAEEIKPQLMWWIRENVDETDKYRELLHETLLIAWQEFDRFTPGTNFRAWVFQILRNKANEYWRKLTESRSKRRDLHSPGGDHPGVIDSSDGDDDAWQNEALESGLAREEDLSNPDDDSNLWKAVDTEITQNEETEENLDSFAAQPTDSKDNNVEEDGFAEIDDDLAINFNLSILDSKMEEALKLLTDPERQVFLERNIFGHTLEEVAKNLGLKFDSVKAYHSTALRKIHSQLSYDFYKSYPELMTAGLVAFPSEQPASYVSYMLMGLMKRYLLRFDPTDQKLWDEAVSALRSRISGGKDKNN